ncbi:hypothetical protein [Vibrio metschnikovii]|uniref:Uncharacterized protein n=1 Tax=Vibrio metschnikovii TaxID=28172 RepID=A0A9X0UPV1_VIBME|nr:hypothetical protein [Vibrio metschnikovii]MBC5853353.1 hypothetical protein [Vibrio metschnikovii]
MDLFEDLKLKNQHKNFLSVLKYSKEADRKELLRWCHGFPDRDNKLVIEFQTTFNSSFWEVYLYALFNELNIPMDWNYSRPDFLLDYMGEKIVVEATIASSANGKTPEWEKDITVAPPTRFKEMNIESIIRLSNSINTKYYKYVDSYSKLEHVKERPFVIAVAPFEQPHFNLQCEVPIMALLYDFYVDEDAYNDAPHLFPNGPPDFSLGWVEKDNGSEIELGIFENDNYADISAIILSTTATWGKVESMSGNTEIQRFINTVWWSEEEQQPKLKQSVGGQVMEKICDGLYVFHNPFAKRPLDPDMFKREGITQVFVDPVTRKITKQRNGDFLLHRQTMNIGIKS